MSRLKRHCSLWFLYNREGIAFGKRFNTCNMYIIVHSSTMSTSLIEPAIYYMLATYCITFMFAKRIQAIRYCMHTHTITLSYQVSMTPILSLVSAGNWKTLLQQHRILARNHLSTVPTETVAFEVSSVFENCCSRENRRRTTSLRVLRLQHSWQMDPTFDLSMLAIQNDSFPE